MYHSHVSRLIFQARKAAKAAEQPASTQSAKPKVTNDEDLAPHVILETVFSTKYRNTLKYVLK